MGKKRIDVPVLRMKAAYGKGRSFREIATNEGLSYGFVRRTLIGAGVVPRNQGPAWKPVGGLLTVAERDAKILSMRDVDGCSFAAIGIAVGLSMSGACNAYQNLKGNPRSRNRRQGD